MIFAKLDVCFWRHKKFMRAGAAACGYYAAALTYLREDETSDGVLENDVLGQLLGVGPRESRRLCERLVEAGLFTRDDRGYVLVGYAEKNETKEQIDARRATSSKKVAAWRERNRAGNLVTSPSCNQVTPDEVTEVRERVTAGSDSDSPSGSVSGSSSGVWAAQVASAVELERVPALPPLVLVHPNERVVRIDDKIPDDLRATATANYHVQDVDSAWLKFCGNNADQVVHVQGRWQSFCATWAKIERSERDRARSGPRKTIMQREATNPEDRWQPGSRPVEDIDDEPKRETVSAVHAAARTGAVPRS